MDVRIAVENTLVRISREAGPLRRYLMRQGVAILLAELLCDVRLNARELSWLTHALAQCEASNDR